MDRPARSEQDIFEDLARLCVSPGYVHAVAFLCVRDSMFGYVGNVKTEDMQHLFSFQRLIRTETGTLLGLALRGAIDYTQPAHEVVQRYVNESEALLEELHAAMNRPITDSIGNWSAEKDDVKPLSSGVALREPIFYGGESAYHFQYRDLAIKKYAADEAWISANKSFNLEDARKLAVSIGQIHNDRVTDFAHRSIDVFAWALDGLTFTVEEVAARAGIDGAVARRVLEEFACDEAERNEEFTSLGAFNVVSARPLIPRSAETFVLFNIYSLCEALYEGPFYWMAPDKRYAPTASKNRGRFVETFAAERLSSVFGARKVFEGVSLIESKGVRRGEIDVLVLFGDKAVVLQAKSKRLTQEARRGNDGQIRSDFKLAIQDSCDQGYECAVALLQRSCQLIDRTGEAVAYPTLSRIYVLCLIADHYPALSFQARQFLQFTASTFVPPPFVLDVFTLDVMTEMLQSPLRLLSYIDRRTTYYDRFNASHELTILAYHLKKNLWVENDETVIVLADDISADLDIAMLVRREGLPGNGTPDGVLTAHRDTVLGRYIQKIEERADPDTTDLGMLLLELSGKAVEEISAGIEEIGRRARDEGGNRDMSVPLAGAGVTFHANSNPDDVARFELARHCELRKYASKANLWFGVCIRPLDLALRFGVNLRQPWKQDAEMDRLIKGIPAMIKASVPEIIRAERLGKRLRRKVGRNELCPCGSGRKYKRCCIATGKRR